MKKYKGYVRISNKINKTREIRKQAEQNDKYDELLAKMKPLPCAECGKPNTVGHICMTNELNNKALADLLEQLVIMEYPRDDKPILIQYIKEAAKRLRDEWIPIKEFLEEPEKFHLGLDGLCFIGNTHVVTYALFYDGVFHKDRDEKAQYSISKITHVIPINKPGLPK